MANESLPPDLRARIQKIEQDLFDLQRRRVDAGSGADAEDILPPGGVSGSFLSRFSYYTILSGDSAGWVPSFDASDFVQIGADVIADGNGFSIVTPGVYCISAFALTDASKNEPFRLNLAVPVGPPTGGVHGDLTPFCSQSATTDAGLATASASFTGVYPAFGFSELLTLDGPATAPVALVTAHVQFLYPLTPPFDYGVTIF